MAAVSDTSDHHHSQVEAEQVRLLYTQASSAILGSVLAWIATLGGLWQKLGTVQWLAWGSAGAIFFIGFAVVARAFRRRRPAERALPRWGRYYLLLALAQGLLWGALAAITLVNGSLFVNTFVVAMLIGISLWAVNTSAVKFSAFAALAIPALVPAIALLFLSNTDLHNALGGLLLAFSIAVLATAYFQGRTLANVLTLRFQYAHRVEDLLSANSRNDAIARELRKELETHHDMARRLQASTREAHSASVAKSQFLASMSHELRTPLNAIIGYSELLCYEAEDIDNPSFTQGLKVILSSGEHLLKLVNNVLDFSKIEAGKTEVEVEDFNVPDLVQQVVSEIRPLCVKNNNMFVVDCPREVGQMLGDKFKLRQVLLNVMSNAIKFTHDGRISVCVSRYRGEQETIRFQISDTGIGIDRQKLQALFSPFVQADASTTRNYGGSGLGLCICKCLCGLMGGDIQVESEIGRGSSFTISLPAVLELPANNAHAVTSKAV